MPALLFCFDIKCCVHWKRVGKGGGNIVSKSKKTLQIEQICICLLPLSKGGSGNLWKKGLIQNICKSNSIL